VSFAWLGVCPGRSQNATDDEDDKGAIHFKDAKALGDIVV
jgi:hypothetical protein